MAARRPVHFNGNIDDDISVRAFQARLSARSASAQKAAIAAPPATPPVQKPIVGPVSPAQEKQGLRPDFSSNISNGQNAPTSSAKPSMTPAIGNSDSLQQQTRPVGRGIQHDMIASASSTQQSKQAWNNGADDFAIDITPVKASAGISSNKGDHGVVNGARMSSAQPRELPQLPPMATSKHAASQRKEGPSNLGRFASASCVPAPEPFDVATRHTAEQIKEGPVDAGRFAFSSPTRSLTRSRRTSSSAGSANSQAIFSKDRPGLTYDALRPTMQSSIYDNYNPQDAKRRKEETIAKRIEENNLRKLRQHQASASSFSSVPEDETDRTNKWADQPTQTLACTSPERFVSPFTPASRDVSEANANFKSRIAATPFNTPASLNLAAKKWSAFDSEGSRTAEGTRTAPIKEAPVSIDGTAVPDVQTLKTAIVENGGAIMNSSPAKSTSALHNRFQLMSERFQAMQAAEDAKKEPRTHVDDFTSILKKPSVQPNPPQARSQQPTTTMMWSAGAGAGAVAQSPNNENQALSPFKETKEEQLIDITPPPVFRKIEPVAKARQVAHSELMDKPSAFFSAAKQAITSVKASHASSAKSRGMVKDNFPNQEHVAVFSSYHHPEKREGPSARPRRVEIENLPTDFTARSVAGLVWGGPIESINYTTGSAKALITFCRGEDASKFFDGTPNGIPIPHYEGVGNNKVAFVKLDPQLMPVTTILKTCLEKEITRVVRAVGVDRKLTIPQIKTMAVGKDRKVEHISIKDLESGQLAVYFRMCSIKDAVALSQTLRRDQDWERCNITYGPDPCQLANGPRAA